MEIMEFDIENFINLVYAYKCLWDQTDSTYNLRDHQRKAWRAISEEIEIPVHELKKKWRGLRDTFGKELKKVNTKKSDTKWAYFKHLLFLQGTMCQKVPKDSVPETCDFFIEERYDEGGSTNIHFEHSPSPSPVQFARQNYDQTPKIKFKSPLKRKVKRSPPDTKLLQIEEETLKFFQENSNDSDTHFLMSLLPFLKDIPKHRKLMVRTKLQQVLIDEQNEIASAAQMD